MQRGVAWLGTRDARKLMEEIIADPTRAILQPKLKVWLTTVLEAEKDVGNLLSGSRPS
jgi:hypothetical protein